LTTVLLDTHVVQWWSAEPQRLSQVATEALSEADELAVAAISWFELAWLARHERIVVTLPVRSWLEQLAGQIRTMGITPAIADTAVSLPSTFPGDPADRLILATAVEHGMKLVTKDGRFGRHPLASSLILW
jgi:PIN domain nuclease of toxin-antitoxin system